MHEVSLLTIYLYIYFKQSNIETALFPIVKMKNIMNKDIK